jgi:acyl carrier protein
MDKNLEKLQTIFKEVFEECPQINLETTKAEIEAWDSMSFLNLIVELESEFDKEFSVDEMESMDSVAAILKTLP